MKQKKLLKQLYEACIKHNAEKIARLRRVEFEKILKRRAQGLPFTTQWTLVRV